MRRGLVYPSTDTGAAAAEAPAGQQQAPDDYKAKLLKYIPGEVLAFFIPVTAAIGADDEGWLVAALIVGAVGALGYLHIENRKVAVSKRAKWWSYVLALIAFVAWAIGTSAATADLFDLEQKYAGIILLFAAFLVPGIDSFFSPEPAQE